MMAGWVTEDGSISGDQKMTPEVYKLQVKTKYNDMADEYLKLFPGNTTEEVTASFEKINLLEFAVLPAYLWAGFSKSKAYIYRYTHVPVDKPGFPNYGAFHTSEVPFALHTLHLWKRPWREADLQIEETMNNYWVNFVKKGDPNGEGLPKWKTFEKSSGKVMEIGDRVRLTRGIYKDECNFLGGIILNKK
jgi:para-nitrobenzyl esterase